MFSSPPYFQGGVPRRGGVVGWAHPLHYTAPTNKKATGFSLCGLLGIRKTSCSLCCNHPIFPQAHTRCPTRQAFNIVANGN